MIDVLSDLITQCDFIKYKNMIRLFFCLLEAALKIHLAQISVGALSLNLHDASEHDNVSVYKTRFKKK